MSILQFGLYSCRIYLGSSFIQVKLSQVRIGLVLNWVRFYSGSGCLCSIDFRSGHYESVISSVGYLGSCQNSGFIRLWIGLLRVFESRLIHPILSVDSDIYPGRLVRISNLGFVLLGLQTKSSKKGTTLYNIGRENRENK